MMDSFADKMSVNSVRLWWGWARTYLRVEELTLLEANQTVLWEVEVEHLEHWTRLKKQHDRSAN